MGAGIFSDLLGVLNPFRFRSYLNSGIPPLSAGDAVFVSDALGETQPGVIGISDGSSIKGVVTRDIYTTTPSYTAISTSQHNIAIGSASDIFYDIGANFPSISGFAGGWNGRRLRVWFKSSAGGITFRNESASSSAANRITMPGANDAYIFDRDGFADFVYDGDSQRWRPSYLPIGDFYASFPSGLRTNDLTLTRVIYLGAFAWASVPSAVTYSGGTILVTDVGNSPILMRSDGTNWLPLGCQTIYASGIAVAQAGSVTNSPTHSVTIPANFLHPNSILEIDIAGGRSAGTTGNVSVSIRVAGTTNIFTNAATSGLQLQKRYLLFDNSRTSQFVLNPGAATSFGTATGTPSSGTLDFTVSTTIAAALTVGAGDTGSIYYFSVRMIR